MQNAERRTQDAGCRMQDAGCRIQDTGHRIQNTKYKIQNTKYRVIFYKLWSSDYGEGKYFFESGNTGGNAI